MPASLYKFISELIFSDNDRDKINDKPDNIIYKIERKNLLLSVIAFIGLSIILKIYFVGWLYLSEILKGVVLYTAWHTIVQRYCYSAIKHAISKTFKKRQIIDLKIDLMIIASNVILGIAGMSWICKIITTRTSLTAFALTNILYAIALSFVTKISDIRSDTKTKIEYILEDEDDELNDISYLDNLGDIVSEAVLLCSSALINIIMLSKIFGLSSGGIGFIDNIAIFAFLLRLAVTIGSIKLFHNREGKNIENITLLIYSVFVGLMIMMFIKSIAFKFVTAISILILPLIILFSILSINYTKLYKMITSVGELFSLFTFGAVSFIIANEIIGGFITTLYLAIRQYSVYPNLTGMGIIIVYFGLIFLSVIGALSDSTEGLIIKKVNEQRLHGIDEVNRVDLLPITEELDNMDTKGNKIKILVKTYTLIIICFLLIEKIAIHQNYILNLFWLNIFIPMLSIIFVRRLYQSIISNKDDLDEILALGYTKNYIMFYPFMLIIILFGITNAKINIFNVIGFLNFINLLINANLLGGTFDIIKKANSLCKHDLKYVNIIKLDLLGDYLKDVLTPVGTSIALLIAILYIG